MSDLARLNVEETTADSDSALDFSTERDFCQKVSRILTGKVQIVVKELNDFNSIWHPKWAVAYSVKNNIYLNFKKILDKCNGDELKFITAIKSLDYHEIGHVLFTNIHYKKDVYENKFGIPTLDPIGHNGRGQVKKYLNVLEDAKIENRMIMKFPNIKKYYLYNVLNFIVDNAYYQTIPLDNSRNIELEKKKSKKKSKTIFCWLLVVGRYFVNPKLVRQYESEIIKQKYLGIDKVNKVKKIFEQYVTLNDGKKQVELGVKLWNTLHDEMEQDHNECAPCSMGEQTKKSISKENENVTQQLKEAVKEFKKRELSGEKTARQSESSGTPDANSSQISPNANSIDANADCQPNNGAGETTSVRDQIEKELEKVTLNIRPEVTKDLDVIRKDGEFNGKTDVGGDEIVNSTLFKPGNHSRIMSIRLKRLLRKLRNGLESRYVKNQKIGRIDIKQVMNKKCQDGRVFKKYLPNRLGKSKMACAFLLDSSGSMSEDNFFTSLQCVWSLNNALVQCNDKTMILEYSKDYKFLKNFWSNKTDLKRHYSHGTTPEKCLEAAYKSLTYLKKTEGVVNNLCFILTDGDWSHAPCSDEVIVKMRRAGIFVVLIHAKMADAPSDVFPQVHPVDETFVINSFDQIEGVCRKVINKVQMNIKNRVSA